MEEKLLQEKNKWMEVILKLPPSKELSDIYDKLSNTNDAGELLYLKAKIADIIKENKHKTNNNSHIKDYKILFWLSFITAIGLFALNFIEKSIYLLALGWFYTGMMFWIIVKKIS